MSYLRKVEMSHSLPKIRAWGANFGLGDDEQAGLATNVDGGSGQPHGGQVAQRPRAKDLLIPTPTIECTLYARLHCSSSPCAPRLTSVWIQPSFQGAVLSSAKGMPFIRASPPASKSNLHVSE